MTSGAEYLLYRLIDRPSRFKLVTDHHSSNLTMTSFTIRPATLADVAHILHFITELAIYEEAEHEVKATISDIEATLFGDGCTAHAIIGELHGKPIGMAVYFFNYSTWLGKNGLYLEDLYVSPEHRGLGFGKKLLARLASIALENDCGRMEWRVLDWNAPAIAVYEAIGAKPQPEWIGYRLTGDALGQLASQR